MDPINIEHVKEAVAINKRQNTILVFEKNFKG